MVVCEGVCDGAKLRAGQSTGDSTIGKAQDQIQYRCKVNSALQSAERKWPEAEVLDVVWKVWMTTVASLETVAG